MPPLPEMAAVLRGLQAFFEQASKDMTHPLEVTFDAAYLGPKTQDGALFPAGFLIRRLRDTPRGPVSMDAFSLQKAMRGGLDAMDVPKHHVARIENGIWIGVGTARVLIQQAITDPEKQARWFAQGFAQASTGQAKSR